MATVYDRGLQPIDKDLTVAEVVVTASGTRTTTSSSSSNVPNVYHWRLYLVLHPSASCVTATQAVVLDMIPANPPTGCFVISSKQTRASTASAKVELPLATVGSPTVQQIIDLFKNKGMDRYRFDATGSGCLWWTSVGVRYLEEAGLLGAGATRQLQYFHHQQAQAHPERHPLPIRQEAQLPEPHVLVEVSGVAGKPSS